MVIQNPELKKYDLLIEQIKRSIDDVNTRLNSFSIQHEELRHKPDIPAEYREFKSFLIEKMKIITESVESFSNQLKDVNSKLMKESSHNENEKIEIDTIKNSIKEIVDSIELKNKELNQKINGLGDSISQVHLSAKEHSNKIIDKLKQEISVTPSSILETNNQILRKIEECKMDCSNAMLKLANFETQFTIFQRKLENLDIRIKKFELEKQG